MNIIFGASGHAKEIDLFLSQLCNQGASYDRTFVVNSFSENTSSNYTIMTEDEFMISINKATEKEYQCYVAVGNGNIRHKIVERFREYSCLTFPNLIPASILYNSVNIKFGQGNILFPSVIFTIDTNIGNHNHFNLNVTVSHDCEIGNYNTFSPGVKIAGSVSIGNNNFFGLGSCVIDKITIGNNVFVGAGAVVIKDLLVPGTYIGIPAKKIQ